MKKILVLCSGNSCRSQMAEGYLNFFAGELAKIKSAGIEGKGVNPLAIKVMAEDNIDISQSSSKTIKKLSEKKFDYLITVCDEVKNKIPSSLKVKKHIHFSIPDPERASSTSSKKQLKVFRETREEIKKYMLKFIGKKLVDKKLAHSE